MMFEEFADKHVMVVGDIMLDRLVRGTATKLAPEAPVPVIFPEGVEDSLGGAGNVVRNLNEMGCRVTLVSAVGEEATGKLILEHVNAMELHDFDIISDPDRLSPLKTRYYSNSHYVLRVDMETTDVLSTDLQVELREKVVRRLKMGDVDGVIVSDYDKGVVTDGLLACLREERKEGTLLVADPKLRNFKRCVGFDVLMPNVAEMEAVWRTSAPLRELMEEVRRKLELQALCVTMGEEGSLLAVEGREVTQYPVEEVPIADVCGAGDTFVSIFTLARLCGKDWSECVMLANVAARIVVGKPGVQICTLSELREVYSAYDT